MMCPWRTITLRGAAGGQKLKIRGGARGTAKKIQVGKGNEYRAQRRLIDRQQSNVLSDAQTKCRAVPEFTCIVNYPLLRNEHVSRSAFSL